ncbi:hypothetical protein GLOIN_2v1868012 [Rhizophagus clarus]|uniref:Uncharacterized protein n=1 Tax=Rhizophagus clarus TaxID=94130 RepID=A0A8H3LEI5_9GLOM|nr:hypothetical protein GLOIN_2v1868012 [Rhizophagus clarus]
MSSKNYEKETRGTPPYVQNNNTCRIKKKTSRESLKKNKDRQLSIFNAKFTLNNVPCEIEYDLSEISLENLHNLAIFTTQNSSNDNKGDA